MSKIVQQLFFERRTMILDILSSETKVIESELPVRKNLHQSTSLS